MNEKICGLLGGQPKNNIIAELHELLGGASLRHFDVAHDSLSEFLKTEKFDMLYVDMSLRLRVMPLMSKTSPEARLGGGVDLILRLPNGKLYGHNTELYGFSELLDQSGLDVAGKKCIILGNGLDAAAVFNVLKARNAGVIALITHDKYSAINDYDDTEIAVVTSRAEPVSLDNFGKLEAIIDIRHDRINSEFAEKNGVMSINGYTMFAAKVKFACECMTGVEISKDETMSAVQKITKRRTSIILVGAELSELGRAVAAKMERKFYDLNTIIERINGRSLEQLKQEQGVGELKRMKRVAVEWAAKQIGAVITVGDDLDELSMLERNGIVIFLPNGIEPDIESAADKIVKSFES